MESSPEFPLLVTALELADLLKVSVRTIRRMDSAGKLPPPVRIGHCKRWFFSEVLDLLRSGSPAKLAVGQAAMYIRGAA